MRPEHATCLRIDQVRLAAGETGHHLNVGIILGIGRRRQDTQRHGRKAKGAPKKPMQLELGLKAQVWSAAPKSVTTAEKLILFKGILAKRKLLFHRPGSSSPRPKVRRSTPVKSCGRSRSKSPYDARLSLSAASVAAVTRNVELL
jgi:hypothetical protein